MKLTATTSSFLLASMALSPSLSPSMVSAAPTGMEAPTSPNPLGSPSIRQFPHLAGSSPQTKRSPAFRTGPGSPRRNIRQSFFIVLRDIVTHVLLTASRLLKVHKRDSPLDGLIDPVTGLVGPLLSPVTGALKPLVGPLLDPLTGLPIAGGLVSKVGKGLGIMGVNAGQGQSRIISGADAI